MFFSFALIATSAEIKPIHHDNCKIEIYSNFIKLKDFNKQTVEYKRETVSTIASLFAAKGYTPVAGFYPGVMLLDVESFLREEEQELVTPEDLISTRGDFYIQKLYCWDVTATIKGDGVVYNNKYKACKNSESYDLIYSDGYDYNDKIIGDAFSFLGTSSTFDNEMNYVVMDMLASETVSGYNPPVIKGYQFSGGPLADSMEAVLLGASTDNLKKYKKIPADIGILNKIPYCCTPKNTTPQCLVSREFKKN